jgi:hypothetical protein
MGLLSTQAFTFRLIANNQQLDVFADEDILLSNNITGLFDLGILPSSFTREITLPGSKINNAFFEHVYDISIDSPFLFATNIKVPAYLEFDSSYLVNGYLQLNKVNVRANKFIESYNITIYGTLSSLGRDLNRFYLNDLASLSALNHTSSYTNISNSWNGNLFDGDIVYPLVDYGNAWSFTPGENFFGLDDPEGGLNIMDYKPAIRVKKVVDAIFEEAGYTYTSSFLNQDWFQDVYMVCNNQLKYPIYSEIDLENFGKVKVGPISGSGMTNVPLATGGTVTQLPWYNILSDPSFVMGDNGSYGLTVESSIRGILNLNFKISGSANNQPENMELHYWPTGSTPGGAGSGYTTLVNFNDYFYQYHYSRMGQYTASVEISGSTIPVAITSSLGLDETFELSTKFATSTLEPGYYYFGISIEEYSGFPGSTYTLDPNDTTKSFIEVTRINFAADNRILEIPLNMPYATNGIKQIDFLSGLQRKFNLVMYPNKTKPSEFIIEPFNTWYSKGQVWDFNKYINLDDTIEVIPANNLAVNELNFGDTLDEDYISQQFFKENNREFGKTYYVDTQNFYSQGKFNVETTFASTPLSRIANTGVSGSVSGLTPVPTVSYAYYVGNSGFFTTSTACSNTTYFPYTLWAAEDNIFNVSVFYTDYSRTTPFNGNYSYWKVLPQYGSTYYAVYISYTGYKGSVTPCKVLHFLKEV